MSDDLPKHELLRKLLNMTTSANDGEALVAIRKANSILKDGGWSWDQLLSAKIRLIGDPWKGMAAPPTRDSAASRVQPSAAPPPRQAPRPQPAQTPKRPPPQVFYDMDGVSWPSLAEATRSDNAIRARRARAAAASKPTINSTVANRFADHCYCCGTYVNATKGFIFHPRGTVGKWEVACKPCNTSTAPIPASKAKPQRANLNSVLDGL